MDLVIQEHPSSLYGPRTTRNATTSDVTAAFAFDYTTRGEKLTKANAGVKYVEMSPYDPDSVGTLVRFCAHRTQGKPVALNIAGNGIYTLSRYHISQKKANRAVYEILKAVSNQYPIRCVISGGQTGIDMAGIVAACALEIPAFILMPHGFKQRNVQGVDENHTEEEIRQQVLTGISELV